MMNKYRCPHCRYILERDFKRPYITSLCLKVGKVVRCKLIIEKRAEE